MQQLITDLHSEDQALSIKATNALGKIGDDAAISALVEVLEKGSSRVSRRAAANLIKIGNQLSNAQILLALTQQIRHSDDDLVVKRAVYVLGKVGGEDALRNLLQTLQDEDENMMVNVMQALDGINSLEIPRDYQPYWSDVLTQYAEFDFTSSSESEASVSQLQRYPYLDCPEQSILDQAFTLNVELTLEPVDDNIEALSIEDPGTDKLPELEVVVRARQFTIDGNDTQLLQIERDDDSIVKFRLTPRKLGEQQIRIDFWQFGRRIGTARHQVMVVENPAEPSTQSPTAQPPQSISPPAHTEHSLDIKLSPPSIPPADLNLHIDLSEDQRTLSFVLYSTKDSPIHYNFHRVGQVTLQATPEETMQAIYQQLSHLASQMSRKLRVASSESSNLTPEEQQKRKQARAEQQLIDQGNLLWDQLIPLELKQEYWKFQDQVKSILITSDEPWIPWEMVKPYRGDVKEEQFPFWCQQFNLSRWLSVNNIPLDQLPFRTVVPVAPVQSDLKSVQAEVRFLTEELACLSPQIRTEAAIGRVTDFEDYVADGSHQFSVLHFACHGEFKNALPQDSAIRLDDDVLRPANIRLFFQQERPLVFINACEVGRVGFSFTQIGGWAEKLVQARVGAFVGAMWEVNDELALLFAKTFYTALLQEKLSIAAAFRKGRETIRTAAPHNSTWLAYTLYADPEARIEVSPDAGSA
ncbi:MAG: CHAT domain-containing protein [Microcoleaceae cyanobacterium]